MTPQSSKLFLIILILCAPFFLATTYVIKENGKEVGRYMEQDGSNETKIVGSDALNKSSAQKPAAQAETAELKSAKAETKVSQSHPAIPGTLQYSSRIPPWKPDAAKKSAEIPRMLHTEAPIV